MSRVALLDEFDNAINVIVVADDDPGPTNGGYVPPDNQTMYPLEEDSLVSPGWRLRGGIWQPSPTLSFFTAPEESSVGTYVVVYTNTFDDAPTQVTFSVNGATTTVALTDGVAELEITTSVPGPIEVSVDVLPGEIITIMAEEV